MPNITPEEQKILEAKYQSLPIGKMDALKLKAAASALLAKIHVITGWNFPEDLELQTILKEQFIKKLIDSYSSVNCDEIEYAFRNCQVKEWGKKLNISLVSEVIDTYLEKRYEVSKLEESKKEPPPIEKLLGELNTWRESVQRAFESYLKGKAHYRLWPTEMYDQLVYDDFISALSYKDYMPEQRRLLCEQLQHKIIQVESILEQDISKMALHKNLQNDLIEYRTGIRDKEVMLVAKQTVILRFFQYLKLNNKSNIYELSL